MLYIPLCHGMKQVPFSLPTYQEFKKLAHDGYRAWQVQKSAEQAGRFEVGRRLAGWRTLKPSRLEGVCWQPAFFLRGCQSFSKDLQLRMRLTHIMENNLLY